MKNAILLVSVFFLNQIGFTADPPMTKMPQEVMQKMTPGEAHKALNHVVGKFNYTMKWWMTSDAKAEDSKGTSVSKWIMNGRFVQQDVKAKMNGQEFQGLGITGYDNVKQEYQSVWLDNMATGMMMATGTKDEQGTLATSGTFGCPMTGEKDKWFRTELKVISKNEHTYAMYGRTQEGKEFKNMEIHYKRK